MKRKAKLSCLIFLMLILVGILSACTGTNSLKETFVEVEGGYALKKFEGGSQQDTYNVPDEHKEKPVITLKEFSIANAEYLSVLNIGKNITTIEEWALTNCTKLTQINVSEENPNFSSVDGVLYSKDKKTLIAYPNFKNVTNSNLEDESRTDVSFTVIDGVETIATKAFYKVKQLNILNLPVSLKNIEYWAFFRCESLKNLQLPPNLEEIAYDAFSFCGIAKYSKLTSLTIPKSVISIGENAFYKCSDLKEVKMERKSSDGMSLGAKWTTAKIIWAE